MRRRSPQRSFITDLSRTPLRITFKLLRSEILTKPTHELSTKMLHTIQPNPSYIYIKKDSPRMVPIAPAPEKCTLDVKRCNKISNTYVGAQAASIARRNARERNRVKQVNDSYNALRKRLPAAIVAALSGGSRRGSGKKLSKVDTLKMVVEYIRYLEGIIEDNDAEVGVKQHTVTKSRHVDEIVFERSNGAVDIANVYEIEKKNITEKRNGVTETSDMYSYEDEGVFGGRNSPYSDAVPSPVGSESSGVYSAYSNSGCYKNTPFDNQLISMEQDELMDAISWWQEK